MSEKIILGTAQFGFDYGISNQSGQVIISEVKRIFKLESVVPPPFE